MYSAYYAENDTTHQLAKVLWLQLEGLSRQEAPKFWSLEAFDPHSVQHKLVHRAGVEDVSGTPV